MLSGLILVLNVKDIVESTTPVGTSKIILKRFINECIPPRLILAGKCVMLTGGLVAYINIDSNSLIVNETISAARAIVQS